MLTFFIGIIFKSYELNILMTKKKKQSYSEIPWSVLDLNSTA